MPPLRATPKLSEKKSVYAELQKLGVTKQDVMIKRLRPSLHSVEPKVASLTKLLDGIKILNDHQYPKSSWNRELLGPGNETNLVEFVVLRFAVSSLDGKGSRGELKYAGTPESPAESVKTAAFSDDAGELTLRDPSPPDLNDPSEFASPVAAENMEKLDAPLTDEELVKLEETATKVLKAVHWHNNSCWADSLLVFVCLVWTSRVGLSTMQTFLRFDPPKSAGNITDKTFTTFLQFAHAWAPHAGDLTYDNATFEAWAQERDAFRRLVEPIFQAQGVELSEGAFQDPCDVLLAVEGKLDGLCGGRRTYVHACKRLEEGTCNGGQGNGPASILMVLPDVDVDGFQGVLSQHMSGLPLTASTPCDCSCQPDDTRPKFHRLQIQVPPNILFFYIQVETSNWESTPRSIRAPTSTALDSTESPDEYHWLGSLCFDASGLHWVLFWKGSGENELLIYDSLNDPYLCIVPGGDENPDDMIPKEWKNNISFAAFGRKDGVADPVEVLKELARMDEAAVD